MIRLAINIQQKKVGIPVTLGELEFFIDTSDNAMEDIKDNYEAIVKKFEEKDLVQDLETAKSVLEEGFDMLLGQGAFEKVYEQTPSAMLCAEYLAALMEGVSEEINKQHSQVQKNIKKKYLNKK